MQYELQDNIAVITFDDGKVNAVDIEFTDAMAENLERANNEADAVVLRGGKKAFCAGYNIKKLDFTALNKESLVFRGFDMLLKLYSYDKPIVAACEGHAIGLGAFILLSSDTRIGGNADYSISLPETAISMDFNDLLLAVALDRIPVNHRTTRIVQSLPCTPTEAVNAGFLDMVVEQDNTFESALAAAKKLAELPAKYYAINKKLVREKALTAMTQFMDKVD